MDINEQKRQVYRELRIFALGELLILGLVCGGFALLGKWSGKVLAGAAVGAGLAMLNYTLMAVGVFRAAEQAERGDPLAGKKAMSLSMLGRYAMMIAVLVICAKSGVCNVIAMVIPLALSRLILFAAEYFRRKEG